MNKKLLNPQRGILLALLALMVATRSHHFASITHLPDASWAVFFLAGFYLQRVTVFGGLLVAAAISDYVAIHWYGVSDFCVSLAYPMLAPAYGAMWIAGRWYAGRHHLRWTSTLPLAGSLLMGAAICEILSGGSFYALSGRYAEITLTAYVAQFVQYFPASFQGLAFYVALAGLIHVVVVAGSQHRRQIPVR